MEQMAGFGIDAEILQEIKEFFEQYDYYRFTGSKIDSAEAKLLWERVNRVIKTLNQADNFIHKKRKTPERRGQNEKF